jgi:hypothetical protein
VYINDQQIADVNVISVENIKICMKLVEKKKITVNMTVAAKHITKTDFLLNFFTIKAEIIIPIAPNNYWMTIII